MYGSNCMIIQWICGTNIKRFFKEMLGFKICNQFARKYNINPIDFKAICVQYFMKINRLEIWSEKTLRRCL